MAKKKASPKLPLPAPSRRLLDGLDQADQLLEREAWAEARDHLAELAGRFPNEADVWTRLVNVAYELGDMSSYQRAAERLLALDPRAHDLRLALAGAYLSTGLPTLALRTVRDFLRLAPDHAKADEARRLLADLEQGLPAILAEMGLAGGAGLKLAELHEEVQVHLARGEYVRARQVAQAALRLKPELAPVLNNLTQAYAADGLREEALATTERVLALQPDNVHALSNRARLLALLGRFDEGRVVAQRLLASTAPALDGALKKAEALSYLGLDQDLYDLFQAHLATSADDFSPHAGALWHLAAVAALRLGHTGQARTWWRAALEREPGLSLALANLKDLDQPVGQQNGPWAYDLGYWLTPATVRELEQEVRAGRTGEAAQGPFRRYLRRHPELERLFPVWLARGAPDMREFTLVIVEAVALPALAQAAKDFALGQAGSDAQRLHAAQLAVTQGALAPGRVRVWRTAAWTEVLLMGIEIHGEPERTRARPRPVERLLSQAVEHMQAGAMAAAEAVLRQALVLDPDAPDLLNNLAATFAARNRPAEAEPIWRAILERHPDYLFARASLGRVAAQRGEVTEARALLDPLLTRRRMHFSEFSALAMGLIETALAAGQPREAQSWLDMWARAVPADPAVAVFQREIQRRSPPSP